MQNIIIQAEDYEFGTFEWFLYAGISCFMVIFAGIMSGLTLGLMSLGLVELEILQRSGSLTEKKQAGLFIFCLNFNLQRVEIAKMLWGFFGVCFN